MGILLVCAIGKSLTEGNLVFGLANSLGELESQVNNNANYRDELINYVNAHGLRDDMQQSGLFPEFLNTFQLEKLVKAHMTECLSTSTPTSGFC